MGTLPEAGMVFEKIISFCILIQAETFPSLRPGQNPPRLLSVGGFAALVLFLQVFFEHRDSNR